MKRKADTFEEFLLESFGDGMICRELRLSAEELAYVKVKYPSAAIGLLSDKSADGKSWFEINLSPGSNDNTKFTRQQKDLQLENERLKLEIEALKKSVDKVAAK